MDDDEDPSTGLEKMEVGVDVAVADMVVNVEESSMIEMREGRGDKDPRSTGHYLLVLYWFAG